MAVSRRAAKSLDTPAPKPPPPSCTLAEGISHGEALGLECAHLTVHRKNRIQTAFTFKATGELSR